MNGNKAFVVMVCAVAATICTGIVSDMVFKYKMTKLAIETGRDISFTK